MVSGQAPSRFGFWAPSVPACGTENTRICERQLGHAGEPSPDDHRIEVLVLFVVTHLHHPRAGVYVSWLKPISAGSELGDGCDAVIDVGESGGQRAAAGADDVGFAEVEDHTAGGEFLDE